MFGLGFWGAETLGNFSASVFFSSVPFHNFQIEFENG